jgi:hypothetical protein
MPFKVADHRTVKITGIRAGGASGGSLSGLLCPTLGCPGRGPAIWPTSRYASYLWWITRVRYTVGVTYALETSRSWRRRPHRGGAAIPRHCLGPRGGAPGVHHRRRPDPGRLGAAFSLCSLGDGSSDNRRWSASAAAEARLHHRLHWSPVALVRRRPEPLSGSTTRARGNVSRSPCGRRW